MAERVQGSPGSAPLRGPLPARAPLGAGPAAGTNPLHPALPLPEAAPKARANLRAATAAAPDLDALAVPEPPAADAGATWGAAARVFGAAARTIDAAQPLVDTAVGTGDVAMNASEFSAARAAIAKFMGRLPDTPGGQAAAAAGEAGTFAWAGKLARPLGMAGVASGAIQALQAFRAEGGPDLMGVAEGMGNATSALADAIGRDFTLSGSYGSALTGLGKVCSVGAVLGGALCVYRNAKVLLAGEDGGEKLDGKTRFARAAEMIAGATQAVAGVMMFIPGLQPLGGALFAAAGGLTLASMAADNWEGISGKLASFGEGAKRFLTGMDRQIQAPAPA